MKISNFANLEEIRKKAAGKILPDRPYIGIGMGTCGIGRGAELLYDSFGRVIRERKLDVQLKQVGFSDFVQSRWLTYIPVSSGHTAQGCRKR